MQKLIPDLPIERDPSDVFEQHFGMDLRRIPDASNEIAAVLASYDFKLRNCGAALARVLGWLTFQARNDIRPEDFLKAITDQSVNYYQAFSRLSPE